jgi:L-threonylcarbamoyladenylate synthase
MPRKEMPLLFPASGEAIAKAASRLRAGELVAVPTETVYGLAARADSADAVARIYEAKGRPDFNPLIVHVHDLAAVEGLAEVGPAARHLAEAFWPGPLTLVLPLRKDAVIAPAVTAGLPTIAIRMPAHPVMRQVLAETGLPLAAPSANRSGAVSPTMAAHVASSLGERAGMILDGGSCEAGLESTIVALRPDGIWQILRPGPIERSRLVAVMGSEPSAVVTPRIEAPGQLASHYAPGKPVRLDATSARQGEFLIGFGDVEGECSLSPAGDLIEAAARLYDCLHQAAASSKPRVAIASIPETGVGAAINDRLRRAAA